MTRLPDAGGRIPKPLRYLINSPWLTAGPCLVAALCVSPFSLQLGLLLVSASYVPIAYYIDRRHLDTFILPPAVIFAVANFVNGSLGAYLVGEFELARAVDPVLVTNIAYTATLPIFLVIYWLINRNVPAMVFQKEAGGRSVLMESRFKVFAFVIVIFTIGLYGMEIATGLTDRGAAGDFVIDRQFGFWSYFEAFAKLQFIGWFLLPYLWKITGYLLKFSMIMLSVIYFLYQAGNSSRGAIVFPLVFLVIGYWTVGGGFRRTCLFLGMVLSFSFALVPILGDFRGSGALKFTDMRDLPARLEWLKIELATRFSGGAANPGHSDRMTTGLALLGCSDPMVYAYTPSMIPFAGWERAGGIVYIWIPKIIFPDKPLLLDGDLISSEYTDISRARSQIGVSLQADLYRRFGWMGIILGYPFYALAVALFVRYAMIRFSIRRTQTWGFVVLLFIQTFVHGVPFGSVLTMAWNFLYDYPKYLFALGVILCCSTLWVAIWRWLLGRPVPR